MQKEIAADFSLLHNLYSHLDLCNKIWKSSCALSITLSSIIKICIWDLSCSFAANTWNSNVQLVLPFYQAFIICNIWSTGSKKKYFSNKKHLLKQLFEQLLKVVCFLSFLCSNCLDKLKRQRAITIIVSTPGKGSPWVLLYIQKQPQQWESWLLLMEDFD